MPLSHGHQLKVEQEEHDDYVEIDEHDEYAGGRPGGLKSRRCFFQGQSNVPKS